ncbi:hypothetical protein THRCLA_09595 [Thraustotheca clavata]|uniref:C2H2-type domain-containing protein n=1 Tax=Thraustotheca clavata TaxID=74557 RepID=A0A1V9YVS3_9STRA|nr:hypothetical protein THRCLA_09595 [Thraustotheca clavata]
MKDEGNNERRDHVCDECGATFMKNAHLIQHQHVHDDAREYVCDVEGCTKTYQRKDHLNRHVKAVHENRAYTCERCGAVFVYKHALVRHITTAHENVNRPYVCRVCQVSFKKKSALQAHSFVHTGILPFPCPEPGCGAAFRKKCLLSKHTVSKHFNNAADVPCFGVDDGDVVNAIQCPQCPLKLNSMKNLTAHLKAHEIANEQFPCPDCDKVYTTKPNLNAHRRAVHEKQMRFTCVCCLEAFTYKHVLKRHLARFHSDHPQGKSIINPPSKPLPLMNEDKVRSRLLGSNDSPNAKPLNDILPLDDADHAWMSALVDENSFKPIVDEDTEEIVLL